MIIFKLTFVLFFCFLFLLVVHGNEICTCDIINNFCDVNCCCDALCTVDDISTFYCYNETQKRVNEVCIDSVYSWNFYGAAISVRQQLSQTCFSNQVTNENNFVNPEYISESNFDSKLVDSNSFKLLSSNMPIPSLNFYKSGDEILTFYNQTNQLGVFSIPQTNNLCYNYPIKFLNDGVWNCWLDENMYNRISLEACSLTSLPLLSPKNYIEFNLIKNPSFIMNITDGYFIDEANLLVVQCNVNGSSNVTCNDVPTRINTTCYNLVQQVYYEVEYDGSNGLTRVEVTLIVVNLPISISLPLKQHYSIRYIQKSDVGVSVRKSSGAPGYLLLHPILVAQSQNNLMCSSLEGEGLTIPGVSCSLTNRQQVLFGVNAFTQCQFNYNASLWNGSCAGWNMKVLNILVGSKIYSHVSAWGVVDTSPSSCLQSPWIPILHYPEHWNVSSCELLTAIDVKVVFGNTGLRADAQPAILALQYNYITSPTNPPIQPCWESSCDEDVSILLSSSVQFVEKSNPMANLRIS